MKNSFFACAAAAVIVGSLQAQTVYLSETFDSTVPPAGWTQDMVNSSCQGWVQSADLRAWHENELFVGTCDDTLWASVDLTGATAAYVHFDLELQFAGNQANHPFSQGDGVTEIVMRPAGATTWTSIWTDCRFLYRRDMMTAVVPAAFLGGPAEVGIRYYGTYAHELWLDLFQVDDDPAVPPRASPPTVWTYMNLPTATAVAPYFQDFESGAAPPEMALTALDYHTRLPDSLAWCEIANTFGTYSGNYCLEMGVAPNAPYGHDVLDAMVLSLDLSALSTPHVSFYDMEVDTTVQPEEGIWISNDGVTWYQVFFQWDGGAWWDHRYTVDLTLHGNPIDFQQPVYLMFAAAGSVYFPYDGVALDDIAVDDGPATLTPTLDVSYNWFTCRGPATVQVEGTTSGGTVVLLYGPGGSFTSTGPCAGTVVDIAAPRVGYVWSVASGSVDCAHLPSLPPGVCGTTLQAVDLASCTPSNSLVL